MTPSPDQHEKLEQLIHRTLRELPPRRAPRSLEARVMAELDRRAALPWWRQNFAHWPVAARVAFLVASAGVVKLVLMAVVWTMAGFDNAQFTDAFAPQFTVFHAVTDFAGGFVNTFANTCGAILRSIPLLWVYAGAAAIAAMYAALFGLGATAYRTLYANRHA
jgi:hypothetical protein